MSLQDGIPTLSILRSFSPSMGGTHLFKARKSTKPAKNQGTQINQPAKNQGHLINQLAKNQGTNFNEDKFNKFDIEINTENLKKSTPKITANLKIATFPFNTTIPEDIPNSSDENKSLFTQQSLRQSIFSRTIHFRSALGSSSPKKKQNGGTQSVRLNVPFVSRVTFSTSSTRPLVS
jgi:hypothetical protein